MKGKLVTWLKGLSNTGKVAIAACAIAVVGIVGAAASAPEVTTESVTQNEQVAYTTTYQEDEGLLTSETKILTPGVAGERTVTYQVTYTGDKETARKQLSEKILKEPTTEVKAKGVKEVATVTATEALPYSSSTRSDSTLAKGTRKTTTAGVNGVRTITYQVTKIRGTEVSRTQVSSEVTTQPVNEVVVVGTKSTVSSSCDPNYSGACVPIASDVDCGGGSGNGPAYLYGTARVVGYDIYDLDRDGDGIACE